MRALLLTALLALVTASAEARDPSIRNLSASATRGQVSVHFSLEGGFSDPQTLEGLQSGVPTGFTYLIEIYRDRPNWFDDGIARARLEIIATFNSVTREYLLNFRRDRRLVHTETFTDFAALQQRMTTIDEPSLFNIGHARAYKMRVRVKADVSRGVLLYFIPWDVSTHWRVTRVKDTEATK